MNILKKYWYLFVVALLTLGLGVVVFLTNQKLSRTQTVAPNVAQEEPEAAASLCKLKFTIGGSGSETTPTPTPTPTNTPTPTPTATPTPTPTPMPLSSCNGTCTTSADCVAGMACVGNSCRNPSCTAAASCTCSITYANPTATPTPAIALTTPTPVPPASCNNSCTVNSDCVSGLSCVDGACRNASCTSSTSCTCEVASAPQSGQQQTPKTPVSGGPTVLGVSILGGGLLILLLGLAL